MIYFKSKVFALSDIEHCELGFLVWWNGFSYLLLMQIAGNLVKMRYWQKFIGTRQATFYSFVPHLMAVTRASANS